MSISTLDNVYEQLKKGEDLNTSKFPYSHTKKTNNRTINLSLGRIWFNLLLPDSYPLVNEPITKQKMNKIIFDICEKYKTEETSEFLQKIQSEAFKLATLSPNTFDINMFIPPKEWVRKKEEFKKKIDKLTPNEFRSEAEKLTKELLDYFKDKNFRGADIMFSGAKGNPITDWGFLLVSKGYVLDIEGQLLGPITSSLNDGFGKIDYYHAAAEARKNFYIRSVLSFLPGYLTRKLANANAGLCIDHTTKDCGSTKTFSVTVNSDIAKLLYKRNYISQSNTIKMIEDTDRIIGRTIKLRSPLYCKSKHGICETCYGDLAKILNTKNIGLLAAGAINKVGINTMMKMRHISESVVVTEVDFIDMIKRSGIDIKNFSEVLDIQKNKIIAKTDCSITIDSTEYTDVTLIDCGNKYQIIGILQVQAGVSNDIIKILHLPFTIMVDCFKTQNIDYDGSIITINYSPGDVIIEQKYFEDRFNERIVDKLFEGGLKYITNPEILTLCIKDKLQGIDLVHIETIVSNMFRDSKDLSKPARLNDYKSPIIVGQKKLSYLISWLSGINLENINKAIKNALIDGKEANLDPLEQIVLEKYAGLE